MAPSGVPAWKKLFDAAERTVGPRMNELARSENVAILVGLVTRTRSELATRSERLSRQMLHVLNLPAGSDVNRLLAEIGSLEREVRELRKQIDAPSASKVGRRAGESPKVGRTTPGKNGRKDKAGDGAAGRSRSSVDKDSS